MGNRKKFKETYIKGLTAVIVNKDILDKNINLFVNYIDSKTDAELDIIIEKIKSRELILPVIIPNGSNAVSYENNMSLIESLKMGLHKKIGIVRDGETTMSPIPRLIMNVPIKKPSQLLEKKRSIPDDQNTKNIMTQQVTGPSKSMSVTSPEIPLMLGNGQYLSIREAIKYRGGDQSAELVLEKMAELGMDISQEVLEKYSSGPEVNNTIKQVLFSMHLDMNIKGEN